jgi:hypothetical protein
MKMGRHQYTQEVIPEVWQPLTRSWMRIKQKIKNIEASL